MRGASQVVLVVKNLPANARDISDAGSIPRSGKSPGEGHDNPLQYSCLENPMDREAWWATVHRVTKSQTRLKQLSTWHIVNWGIGVCFECISSFLRKPFRFLKKYVLSYKGTTPLSYSSLFGLQGKEVHLCQYKKRWTLAVGCAECIDSKHRKLA